MWNWYFANYPIKKYSCFKTGSTVSSGLNLDITSGRLGIIKRVFLGSADEKRYLNFNSLCGVHFVDREVIPSPSAKTALSLKRNRGGYMFRYFIKNSRNIFFLTVFLVLSEKCIQKLGHSLQRFCPQLCISETGGKIKAFQKCSLTPHKSLLNHVEHQMHHKGFGLAKDQYCKLT